MVIFNLWLVFDPVAVSIEAYHKILLFENSLLFENW